MWPINGELAEQLKKYVRPDQPFGPPDAADIKEPACAAALFDWNNSAFAELLTGSDVLVGRRGSGKSSLLSTFKGKRFLNRELVSDAGRAYRDRYGLSAKTLTAVPDFTIEADTPLHVDAVEIYCRERQATPPVEIMAQIWRNRIWVIVARMLERSQTDLWRSFPDSLQAYLGFDDVVSGSGSHGFGSHGRMTPDDFTAEMESALRRTGKRCVITFDNLERYKFDDVQNAVLGGLIAATGKMIGVQHPSLDVKLCVPAEVFEHLRSVIFRPDKDLQKVQYLRWNSTDLMHLAACRLKVFLQLHDGPAYDLIKDIPLTDRSTLQQFWRRYLPDQIRNAVGVLEDAFTCLLRHTQLLPRQLLTTLNALARRTIKSGRGLFRAPFEAADIIRGIEDTEDANTQAVLGMYEPMYPRIREIFDLVMPRLTHIFDYGRFHSVYNSSAKRPMQEMDKGDFRLFWRLMLSTGAIGVMDREYASDIYAAARFEFNSNCPLLISDKDHLCVHPMFARVFNVGRHSGTKLVLPRGADFGEPLSADA